MRTVLPNVVTATLALTGCSGTAKTTQIPPKPAPETRGDLAGPLCQGIKCTCRNPNAPADGGAGLPTDATKKRYEVRLGPSPQALWATVGDTVLYKSAERAEECFYVDLAAGDHPVELRASAPEGVSASWIIKELGTNTKSWYDTFDFECGSPGVCSFSEIDEIKQQQSLVKRNLRDPCGSTKVKSIVWDTGAAPDQEHPSELYVKATLQVYKFAPYRPHGDDTCGQGGGQAPNEEPGAPTP